MPRAAIDAALDTFALVMRERHPGVMAVPLRDAGTNGAARAPTAGQVIRPFACPERPRLALDWNARDWTASIDTLGDRAATEAAPTVGRQSS
jgi:hypothetical protein